MDDLYAKIQIFLMKKNAECGQLRFLTSRTTLENLNHIQNVCDTIGAILRSSDVPVGDDSSKTDPRCVQIYKYLVLNTYFECQEHLAEDLVNGHLVDMCPALSPYLLAEILWSLRYHDIVAESILHFPLDLCVEILDIARRCLALLDFHRALDFVVAATLNCYKKMIVVGNSGTQSNKLEESLELLTINWQELIALFSDEKFLRLHEVADVQKSERIGTILKRVLGLTKDCLKTSREGVESTTDELSSIYRMTFGRAEVKRSNDDYANHLRMLDQEFAHLLLKKLKEVDCNTYLDWASLESAGNRTISVQQSIGHDCHSLVEIIKLNEHLLQHNHLIECLQQLSCKPQTETQICELRIDELRREASNGNKDHLKELMNRYRDWNHEAFDVIDSNKNLLDKDDFFNLLEYFTLVMTKPGQEEHKKRVYKTVTKVLMSLNITDVYETILEYILNHDGLNTLETAETEKTFKNFMSRNKNFRSTKNLRVLLFFMMKNPKLIISIVLKIVIGHEEFANIMISPVDFTLLSPITSIRENPNETLLISALREVCIDDFEWNAKKFSQFLRVMLENCMFTVDDVINNVFVPFLNEKNVTKSNLNCVLNCLRKIATNCTKKTRVMNLLKAVGRTMSRMRNDVKLPKFVSNELLSLMTRVVQIYLRKCENFFENDEIQSQIVDIEGHLDPIDRPNFVTSSSTNLSSRSDVFDVITHYERKCFVVMNRIKIDRKIVNDGKDRPAIDNFACFRADYLRHLFVKSTEREYVKFATEATIIDWMNFRYSNAYEAYEKIVEVTIQACVYCLEFPDLNSPDSFACLMKGLARYTRGITSLEEMKNPDKIYESLIVSARNLKKFVDRTIFADRYVPIILSMNNRARHEPIVDSLREFARLIDEFGNECMEIPHNEVRFDGEHSIEAARYKIGHDFVNEFIGVSDDGSYKELCRIYKLLSF